MSEITKSARVWSNPGKQRAKSFYERFFEKVELNGPLKSHMKSRCWEWLGYKTKCGYGRMKVFGNLELCHRVSWRLHNNSIPKDSLVLHKCDNPACVNPRHLFLGSNSDNARDRENKGRSARNAPVGEDSKWAKLSANDVLAIRKIYPRVTQDELAQRFGVGRQTISHIICRTTWRHL